MTREPATYLRLEVTVDNVEAVQVGEGKHDLRCVQLPLVIGKSVCCVRCIVRRAVVAIAAFAAVLDETPNVEKTIFPSTPAERDRATPSEKI